MSEWWFNAGSHMSECMSEWWFNAGSHMSECMSEWWLTYEQEGATNTMQEQ